MSHRIERFTSTLKQCLADILLNEAGNPHLKSVIITDIIVNPDLKRARVYISVSGGGDSSESVIRQLEQAKGYIKKLLAQKMYLRYVPELIFIAAPPDDIFDKLQQGTPVPNS